LVGVLNGAAAGTGETPYAALLRPSFMARPNPTALLYKYVDSY